MARRKRYKPRTTLDSAPDEGLTSIRFLLTWKLWKQIKTDALNNNRSISKQLNWVLNDIYRKPLTLRKDPFAEE